MLSYTCFAYSFARYYTLARNYFRKHIEDEYDLCDIYFYPDKVVFLYKDLETDK